MYFRRKNQGMEWINVGGNMLSNFIISIEAVLPIIIMMGIGMLVRRAGMLDEHDVKKMNKVVFTVFFPVLMFSNLYGKDLGAVVDWRLIIFGVAVLLIIYALAVIFVLHIEPNPKTRGAMIQGIYRSNFVVMGVPVVSNIFGAENLTLTSLMVTIIVPMYNVLAVLTLEAFRGGRPSLRQISRQLAKNPLILGALAGIAVMGLGIRLPDAIENTVSSMAGVATPMALLTLGAFFDFQSVAARRRDIAICLIGRLLVVPAVGLGIGILMGFRDVALITLLAMFASPCAVAGFPMAQAMDSDVELAGDVIVFSSLFGCFTMFFWIFVTKSLGLF